MNEKLLREKYTQVLGQYLNTREEHLLYRAQHISKEFIDSGISPQQVIAIHLEAMKSWSKLPPEWDDSFSFFLEFMTFYDLTYRERSELLSARSQLMEELALAASVQQSLLPDLEKITLPPDIDIGIVSVAARKVSGDFYNIVSYEQGVEFGVADVSGKSMPGAIIMSMMKFAMDDLLEDWQQPHMALTSLNSYLYRNSDSSMFVTMFWGQYDAAISRWYYSSAGHEPALYYRAKEKTFKDLITNGSALGLSNRFRFETRSIPLEPGDFILLYTDGVIESRDGQEVDNNESLRRHLLEMDLGLPAQELADRLYRKVIDDNPLSIQDDQTLLLFKKNHA